MNQKVFLENQSSRIFAFLRNKSSLGKSKLRYKNHILERGNKAIKSNYKKFLLLRESSIYFFALEYHISRTMKVIKIFSFFITTHTRTVMQFYAYNFHLFHVALFNVITQLKITQICIHITFHKSLTNNVTWQNYNYFIISYHQNFKYFKNQLKS